MNAVQTIRYKNEVLAVFDTGETKKDKTPIYGAIIRTYNSVNSAKRLNRKDVDVTCTTEKQFAAYRRDFHSRYGIRHFQTARVSDTDIRSDLPWGESRHSERIGHNPVGRFKSPWLGRSL